MTSKKIRKRELSLLGDALWQLMSVCDKVRLRVGECRNSRSPLSALRASLIEDLTRRTWADAKIHLDAMGRE